MKSLWRLSSSEGITRGSWDHSGTGWKFAEIFYQPPQPETLRNWRDDMPADFAFILEAWQLLLHPYHPMTFRSRRCGHRRNQHGRDFHRPGIDGRSEPRSSDAGRSGLWRPGAGPGGGRRLCAGLVRGRRRPGGRRNLRPRGTGHRQGGQLGSGARLVRPSPMAEPDQTPRSATHPPFPAGCPFSSSSSSLGGRPNRNRDRVRERIHSRRCRKAGSPRRTVSNRPASSWAMTTSSSSPEASARISPHGSTIRE